MKKINKYLKIIYVLILTSILAFGLLFVFRKNNNPDLPKEQEDMMISAIYAYNYKNTAFTIDYDDKDKDYSDIDKIEDISHEFNKSMVNVELMLFNENPTIKTECVDNLTTATITFYGLNAKKINYKVTYTYDNGYYFGSISCDKVESEFNYSLKLHLVTIQDEQSYYYYDTLSNDVHRFNSTNEDFSNVSLELDDQFVILTDELGNVYKFTLFDKKIYINFSKESDFKEYTLEVSLKIDSFDYIYVFKNDDKTTIQLYMKRV